MAPAAVAAPTDNSRPVEGAPESGRRRVVPASVDIDGTVSDQQAPVALPPSGIDTELTSKQDLLRELAPTLSSIDRGIQTLQENCNLLTSQNYGSWIQHVQTTNEEIKAALQANDQDKVRQLVRSLEANMKSLGEFIATERQQGLVATHAETGVRIYLTNGQLYFISPDQQAFDHTKKADERRDFVRVTEGYGSIERTAYQDQGVAAVAVHGSQPTRNRHLLGCRLDRIALSEREDKQYVIRTKLRSSGDNFQDFEIRFTLAGAQASGVGENPNQPGAVRGIDAFGTRPAQSTSGNEQPGANLGDTVQAAATRTASVNTPTQRLIRDEAGEGPSQKVVKHQKQVTTELEAHKTRLRDLKIKDITDSADIKTALDELDEQRTPLKKLIAEREKFLQAELKRISPWEDRATAITTELRELDSMRSWDTLKTKALLEKQISLGDSTASKAAKIRLLSLADDIDSAYKALLDKDSTSPLGQALKKQHADFQSQLPALRDEVRNWGQKVVAKVGEYLETNSWVKWVREKEIFSSHPLRDYLDRRMAAKATTAAGETASLCSKDYTAMDAKARQVYLGELEDQQKLFKARTRTLERQISSGATGLDAELKLVGDAHASVALRRAECLAQQIQEVGPNGKGVSRLRTQLYVELADSVHEAYAHLEKQGPLTPEQQAARQRFQDGRQQFQTEQNITQTRTNLIDPARLADREIRQADKAVADAADGTPAKAEAEATRELAKTRQAMIDVEARISHFDDRLNLEPENADIQKQRVQAEAELSTLKQTEYAQLETVKRCQIASTTARVAEIDAELAKTAGAPDAKTRTKLLAEKNDLIKRSIDLETDIEALRSEAAAAPSATQQAQLAEQLKAAKAELKAATDQSQKDALNTRIEELQRQLALANMKGIDAELTGLRHSRNILQSELTKLSTELQALADQGSDEAVLLRSREKSLKTRIDGLNQLESLLSEKREILRLEHRARYAESRLPQLRSELDNLLTKEKTAGSLSSDELLRKAHLEERIARAATYRADAAAARGGFVDRWKRSFGEMRANGARMLQQLKSAEWDVMNPRSAWHTKIEGPGRWMEANPMKSAMLAAGITEALHMTTINWDDDAVHTPVPAVVFLLEKPLETWGLDLDLAQFEFTTKESSTAGVLTAETVSRTGNVAAGLGTLYLIQRGAQASPLLQRGLGFIGAPLAHVGSAYFGYAEFSNLEHWQNDSDTALAGRVASPIVAGALAGSFFGPPGAVIGAGAGAVGEAIGVTHALIKLDYQMDKEWKQCGVRDSIALAINGYVLPEDDDRVQSRGELSDEEREVIDDFASELSLRRIFGMAGERRSDGTMVDSFGDEELEQAGFMVVGENASPEELETAGRHNWERLNNLFHDVEDNYNPFTSWTYLDDLKSNYPELGARFEAIRNSSRNYYSDLYKRSMQVTHTDHRTESAVWGAAKEIWYNHWASPAAYLTDGVPSHNAGKVESTSEQLEYLRELAQEFRQRFDEKEKAAKTPEQKRALAQEEWSFFYDTSVDLDRRRVPGIERILREPQSREIFLNMLESNSRVYGEEPRRLTEYAMWVHADQCETGSYMLQNVMPDKFLSDKIAEGEKLVAELNEPTAEGQK